MPPAAARHEAAALTADAEASDDGVDSWTQSLVRQALRSRWRGRCSVLNPEAWGWLLPTGDSMTPHEPPHAADCLLPTAWLPAAKTL